MPKTNYRSIKGTYDILPAASWRWRALEATIHHVLTRAGYQEIRTPAFEQTELFTHSVGSETDIVTKEMYSWVDQGGDHLTLKPESTASVVRAYLQHNLAHQSPVVRLYYFDTLFRRERPQKGRQRQFHQFGIEALGSPHPEQDAEVILLAYTLLQELGLEELSLKLNSIGSPESRSAYREALRQALRHYLKDLTPTSQRRFATNPLRILDTKVPEEQEIIKQAPTIDAFLAPEDSAHFKELCGLLEQLDIPYVRDPYLVRGLDYYTRTTFEITSPVLGAQDALCGGGRYDDLVASLGGKPTPAIGFATGVERVLLAQEQTQKMTPANPLQVFLIGLGPESRPILLTLLNGIRQAGLGATFDPLRRSLKAQLREANRTGVRFSVILGEEELRNQQALVKDLTDGKQKTVPLSQVVEYLRSAFN